MVSNCLCVEGDDRRRKLEVAVALKLNIHGKVVVIGKKTKNTEMQMVCFFCPVRQLDVNELTLCL